MGILHEAAPCSLSLRCASLPELEGSLPAVMGSGVYEISASRHWRVLGSVYSWLTRSYPLSHYRPCLSSPTTRTPAANSNQDQLSSGAGVKILWPSGASCSALAEPPLLL
jgi:hypothetical protein